MASPPQMCPLRFMDQNFGMCISPRDIILPYFCSSATGYYRPWKWGLQDIIKESTVKNEEDKFQITLDVDQFRIEEITVKVNDKEIKIEGNHKERKDNHGFVSRQFSRRYALPQYCLSENVTSSLSSDGILTVIAKKTKALDKAKIVPIQRCGACPKMKLQEELKSSTGTIKKHTESEVKAKEDEMHKKLTQIMLKDESENKKCALISGTDSTKTDFITQESKMMECADFPMKKSQIMLKDDIKETKTKDHGKSKQKDSKSKDVEKQTEELYKKNSQIILKEEHSNLLRPELLGEAVTNSTEKILAETRKVTEELMKMTEKFGVNETKASTSNIEENMEQTMSKTTEISTSELMASEQFEHAAMSTTTTETKTVTSISSEVAEMQKASSYSASSMASNMAIRSEMTTDLLSDIISAELRDAAENK